MGYNDILEKINLRLKEDPSLKQKLLDNPKETVFELTGEKVPGNITFHTAKENTFTFVIPLDMQENEKSRKLLDGDLDSVTGGMNVPKGEVFPGILDSNSPITVDYGIWSK